MFFKICLAMLALALAACSSADDSREWMKVNERYTVQDFRRDHAECSRSGKLDDVCMRNRGWVDVSSRKAPEKGPLSDRNPAAPGGRGY
jgi:hypothetical protein